MPHLLGKLSWITPVWVTDISCVCSKHLCPPCPLQAAYFSPPLACPGLVGSSHDLSQHITPCLVHKRCSEKLVEPMNDDWVNKGIRLQSQFALFDPLVVSLFTWKCKSWWPHKAVSCQVESRELWSIDQHLPGSRHGRMGVCLPCPHGSQKTGFAHSSPVDSQEIWLWNRIRKDWGQFWDWRSKGVSFHRCWQFLLGSYITHPSTLPSHPARRASSWQWTWPCNSWPQRRVSYWNAKRASL